MNIRSAHVIEIFISWNSSPLDFIR